MKGLTMFDGKLCDDRDCTKCNMMLSDIMTEHAVECGKLFESFVDGFMSSPHRSSNVVPVLIRSDNAKLPPVSLVSLNLLPWPQKMFDSLPGNVDVWPLATWKWAIEPNDGSSSDANSNLVSHTGTFEFVRTPPFPEWFPLTCLEISSVN